jgi:hypothetical protein
VGSHNRQGRLWIYVDAGLPRDAKILAAGERAAWLFIEMMCEAKRTGSDGVLTSAQIAKLGVSGWRARLKGLLDHDLVVELPMSPGSYAIVNWDGWQPSQQEIEDQRATWRRKKRPPSPSDGDSPGDSPGESTPATLGESRRSPR